MTATVDNKTVKVGDTVGFKSDLEQYGRIVSISQGWRGKNLTLEPAGPFKTFIGDYIGGCISHVVNAEDCWID
jgi:hypothetical protein